MKSLCTFDFWGTLAYGNPEHPKKRDELLIEYYWKFNDNSFYSKSTMCLIEENVLQCFKELKTYYDNFAELYPMMPYLPEQCYGYFLNTVCGCPKKQLTESLKSLENDFKELFFKYPPILYPNTKEVISDLNKNYEIGVVTNLNYARGVWIKEYLHKELPEISFVIGSDKVKVAKPAPKIFHHAFDRSNYIIYPLDYILHVGDNPVTDGGINEFMKRFGSEKNHFFQINSNDKTIVDIYEHLQILGK